MSNFFNNTNNNSNTLSRNTFCFDTRIPLNKEKIPLPLEYTGLDKNCYFGILNIQAETVDETTDELDFLFTVDCSGSMEDRCDDGKTKMYHIIHTLKNMVIFLSGNKNMNINISINKFHTKWYCVVPRTRLNDKNYGEILGKISSIQSYGSTNIEHALSCSLEQIKELQTLYPANKINHIFMTDGEATSGSNDLQILRTLVSPNVMNAFIGFGIHHDAGLLNGLCLDSNKSEYYFIDKLENSGFIYGEILHSIVYKVITDVTIKITNGLIYDFKNNSWKNTLEIGDIVSEANKFYHIVSDDCESCAVMLVDNASTVYTSIKEVREDNESTVVDLTQYMYRQQTLQILYEANSLTNYVRERLNEDGPRANKKKINEMKQKLSDFLDEMKKYMEENDQQENRFIKNLCDDIYICYRTFGTRYGAMYCAARQLSQGTQRQYTVSAPQNENNSNYFDSNTQDLFAIPQTPTRPNLKRSVTVNLNDTSNLFDLNGRTNHHNHHNQGYNEYNDYDDDDDSIFSKSTVIDRMLQHDISDFTSSPYLTPQATQVMRFLSSGSNSNTTDDKDEEIEGI